MKQEEGRDREGEGWQRARGIKAMLSSSPSPFQFSTPFFCCAAVPVFTIVSISNCPL